MSKTVGVFKADVLHRMREYSNAGVVQDDTDYIVSMVPLINLHQTVLARDTKCITRQFQISHNKPDNLLGAYTWNEQEVHIDTDEPYEALGPESYSLQIADYATVIIEESLNQTSWNTLYTITKTMALLTVTDGVSPVVTALDGSEGFVTVKGLTGVTSSSYYVRIRFTGNYRYAYRWVALFAEKYYDDSMVPEFEPFVPYDLPENFYEKGTVHWTYAYQRYDDYNEYRFEKFNKSYRRILINWYVKGEFTINYFAFPTYIPVPDIATLTTSDAYLLDVPDDVVPTLVDLVASDLLRDENAYMSDTFKNSAYIGINQINEQSDSDEGLRRVINKNNW